MNKFTVQNKEVLDWISGFLDWTSEKKEKNHQESKIEMFTEAEIMEAVSESRAEEENEAYCTCNAHVMCQYAFRSSDPVHVIKNHALVHIDSLGLLNQTDIELNRTFSGCMKAPKEEKFKCSVDPASIEGGVWQGVNEKNNEGEGKGFVSENSYMICTKYGGILYFCDNGQERFKNRIKALIEQKTNSTFNESLYESNETYRLTAQNILHISETYEDFFQESLIKIQEVYNRERERYEKISKENAYIPPELIAAIHYQENADDFINERFQIYLHNGDKLGDKSEKYPYPDFKKDEFDIAALDALTGTGNYLMNRARNLNLTSESKDLTAMATFASVYNGWNNEEQGRCPYVYNGTNLYEIGLYTSDFHYDPEAKYKNCGVYLILLTLLNQ